MKLSTIDYIDSLRGIAIILVLIVHSGFLLNAADIHLDESMRILMWFWQFWVILFFLVSAYTLFRSLDLRKEINIKYFFIRRFFRIAPLYYLIITLLFFFTSWISEYRDVSISWITIVNLLLHIFFLNGFFPNTYNSIIWVEWTIFVEVWFYILLPILYAYRKFFNRIFISYILIMFWTFLIILKYQITWLSYVALYKSPLIQFFSFFIWCYLYINENNEIINSFFRKYKYIISVSLLTMILLLTQYAPPFLYVIMTGIFACFFLLVKNNTIYLFNNKLLQFIWRISFSLYLTHFVIIKFITANWSSFHLWNYGIVFIYSIVYWIILLISTCTYELIEKPFMWFWKKLISS